MDHLGTMLNSNLDDFVTGKIGADRSVLPTLSDHICFVGLCNDNVSWEGFFLYQKGSTSPARTLPVHR